LRGEKGKWPGFLRSGQNTNGTATSRASREDAGALRGEVLFQFRQDLLLILQNSRLVFLDRSLIGLENRLVRENRFLVLQNLLLVSDHVFLSHFLIPHFQNDLSGSRPAVAAQGPGYFRPLGWTRQYYIIIHNYSRETPGREPSKVAT
jgi:hypothetical protein